jgi:peptide/nickel transport system substrate-binding protein
MKRAIYFNLLWVVCVAVILASCGGGQGGGATSKKANDNSVTIHSSSDLDKMNPYLFQSANAGYVVGFLFQQLIDFDPKTLEIIPYLAVKRPDIHVLTDGPYKGGMSLTYEIRPEATWDNGQPITGHDYVFSVKTIQNPKVDCATRRPNTEFIKDIQVDATNPKKFTIFTDVTKFNAETASGGFSVIPEYVYDPAGLMKEFSIKDLSDVKTREKLAANPKILQYAEQFNSPKYSREKGYIVGSGPYEFTSWETGQSIVLTRKKNYWGDKLPQVRNLMGRPDKIVLKIITDRTAAVTMMKDQGLDVMYDIAAGTFLDLKKNTAFTSLYNMHNPMALNYYYLELNRKNPILADVKVRRALAHVVDYDDIIETIMYGLAERTTSPIHPSKPYFNKDLKPIPYDIEQAKQLLKEAGWNDTDGNGILDKVVNGKKTPLRLSYKFNSDNSFRKEIGLSVKETAKRAGIEIDIIALEWTVFLDDAKKRDYDILSMAWGQSHTPDDLKQIWHTEADTQDGSNRVGFGNAASDKLITDINRCMDEAKRNDLYKQFQQMVYDDQPYIFLFTKNETIAIHNRFEDAEPTVMRPGFIPTLFKLRGGSAAAQ